MSESDSAQTDQSADDTRAARPGGPSRPWFLVALIVFSLACVFLFRVLIGQDPTEVVPANIAVSLSESRGEGDWDSLAETDLRFVVWLVARNAWTLRNEPTSLYQAEQCHPTADALVLGEPGIGIGLLAAPLSFLIGDPVALFNATLVVMTMLAALAMFLLVREWSGSAPAGIVAGLFYAFHLFKIGDLVHVVVWDTTWTVFALYFTTRLVTLGRNRDALGLAGAILLQMAGSLYPLIVAALVGGPVGAFLLWRHGLARIGRVRLLALVIWTGLCAAFFLGPYLAASDRGEIAQTPFQAYFSLAYVLPGGQGFAGFAAIALAAVALVSGRRTTTSAVVGDMRWVLLAIGALIFSISIIGGGEPGQRTVPFVRGDPFPGGFPNLYLLLSTVVPGLDVVRGPGVVYCGVHLVLAVLAGLGSAALIRRVPRHRQEIAAAALIAVMAIDVLRPGFLGLTPSFVYRAQPVRPSADSLALFRALEAAGDEGPVLEVPVNRINMRKSSEGLLLTAYHHRRTSHCYNSFFPAEHADVEKLAAGLPDEEALRSLYGLGFRTLVVHHGQGELGAAGRRTRFGEYARREGSAGLEELAGNASLTAYRIAP